MVDVLMPEKRGGLNKIFSMFSQGSNLMQMGAKGKEGFSSMFGGGEAAAGSTGGGGGALGLGLPALTTQSDKVAPLGQASTGGGGAAAAAPSILGPAAGIGAGYVAMSEYGRQKDREASKRRDIGIRDTNKALTESGFKWGQDNQSPSGLSLTEGKPDRMSAIERRYDSSGDAMSAIHEAQASLKDANLPAGERRSIYQKLELAKQQGGSKRGSAKSYT